MSGEKLALQRSDDQMSTPTKTPIAI